MVIGSFFFKEISISIRGTAGRKNGKWMMEQVAALWGPKGRGRVAEPEDAGKAALG